MHSYFKHGINGLKYEYFLVLCIDYNVHCWVHEGIFNIVEVEKIYGQDK